MKTSHKAIFHNREIEKLKSDFEQITQRQDSADERMDKADTKNNKLEERVVSLETAAPANAEENVYQEMRERKNKESNVIIHGIAESKSKRPSDRKSDDIEEVRGVYSSRHFEIFPIPYFQHFEKLPQNFGGSYQDSL